MFGTANTIGATCQAAHAITTTGTPINAAVRRAIGVVASDEIDLATVYTALVVNHRQIRRVRLAYGAVGRSRATVGHGITDLNLSIVGARSVLAPGPGQSRCEYEAGH
jgi:hypothetical protein